MKGIINKHYVSVRISPSLTIVNSGVNMKLVPIKKGVKFNIVAIDKSDDPDVKDCPAEEFILQMETDSKKSITNIFVRHADHGPILNEEKSRYLNNGIYEFKTTQGDRVLYFYKDGGLTILTHGCIKPKKSQVTTEVQKAVDLRKLYLDSLEPKKK